MNQESFVNNGLKGINERIIPDGVYVIGTNGLYNQVLSIIGKSTKPETSVNFTKKTTEAHQFFFIKYNDELDYYTIMALNSHLYLGVEKKEDSNYNKTFIFQNSISPNHLSKWEITFDNGYYFKLKEFDYYLQYVEETKIGIVAKKNNSDSQKFFVKVFDLISSGLYYIYSMTPKEQYVTISKNEKQSKSYLCPRNQSDDQLFYIVFDEFDGCYSIININNLKCLSPGKNPQLTTKIKQTDFYNLDYQKWIIGTNDKKSYFILLKSDDLLLSNPISNNKNDTDLCLKPYNSNKSSFNINFQFQSNDDSLLKKFKSQLGLHNQNLKYAFNEVKKMIIFRYHKKIVASRLFERASKMINSQLLENSYTLTYLEIPLSIVDVHENALINCSRIKFIKCHPKWLKLLPNPINVENIVVQPGVEFIEKDSFKNFKNLKYLSLPDSFKLENCDPNLFNEIYGLKIFEGDLKFLSIIQKDELITVNIPFFVKEIPENACAGCESLKEVHIEENSMLKIIKSKAFAGCRFLRFVSIPESVKNIAPNAFKGCNKDFNLSLRNEKQRISMIKRLVIDSKVTNITDEYKKYINIKYIEIPNNVQECQPLILKSFEKLKYVKCDPKWLNSFNTDKIEIVTIPNQISELKKQDFENFIHLKLVEIPESVQAIEEGTFDNCNELFSVKCGISHFKFLNQKKIKSICLNEEVERINEKDFEEFVNLESLKIDEKTKDINPNAFKKCKKLMIIDHSIGKSLINNSVSIDENTIEITKNDFKGWINLKTLVIPNSIIKIEDDSFKDCINIKCLTCDPKWFPYIPKKSITKIIIPQFVKEIKKGQFDGFDSMIYVRLPKEITIKDSTVFDSNENLRIIECKSSIFTKFSDKTIERCDTKLKTKFENPIFNFQPDLTKVHDETQLIPSDELENNESISLTNSVFLSLSKSEKRQINLTVDELIAYDPSSNYYKHHITNVLWCIQSGEIKCNNKPKDTSISEISNICGAVCYEISNKLTITPRVVQIYAILRLADEILNNNSHGLIGEIKPGEGKTLIITILAIILVKYNRTIDITTSNLKFAKQCKNDQSKYFDLFHIQTGVFCDKRNDSDKLLNANLDSYKEYDQAEFNNFNLKVFDCPVVYSTNRNFEYYYLHTLFSMIPRKRDFDVVLVDGVDNMLIDELDSPAIISKEINFALSKNIFCIIYSIRFEKITEIVKILSNEFPNASDFNEQDIELLRNAALEADSKKKDVDYIVENKKVIIIDRNTGFRMPNSHWPNYVLPMVEVKEYIIPKSSFISLCHVTQQTYFNLYKKIAGITGTLGSQSDEKILKEGYNVNTFKVPRNIPSNIEIYYKNRPDSIEEVFNLVNEEIMDDKIIGRPVLVIWDTILNAESFMKSHNLDKVLTIFGTNKNEEEIAIDSAGNARTVTLATSAAIRGIEIILKKEALKLGGLHIIIPMKISNIRSLEQHVGIAGRQGQPGSITIFISKEDLYVQTPLFNQRNENLLKIQFLFTKYIKDNFSWMFYGPKKHNFENNIVFPFASSYSDIFNILSRHIFLIFNESNTMNETKIFNKFQDLAWIMVQTAWGCFFTKMQNDKLNNDSWTYCEREYIRFIKELNNLFVPEESKTIYCALNYFNSKFASEKNNEHFIYKGFKISSSSVTLIPANNKNDINNNLTLESSANQENDSFFTKIGTQYKWIMNKLIENKDRIPGIKLLNKTPKVNINHFKIDFIKMTVVLAKQAYDGKFSIGRIVFSSETNDLYKPKFYCVEYLNKLFVVTRGSESDVDWMTDFMCEEVCENINGTDFYFHKGFLTSAKYILSNVTEFIERDYEGIYFVGHSYGAAVSNVLCMLTKMHKNFKDKKIFSLAFAPPPSMSKIPAYIQECMFSFINKNDIVPHLSLNNIKNTVTLESVSLKEFIESKLKIIKAIKIEYAQNMAKFVERYKNDIFSILDSVDNVFHVHKNIGNIFYIGISYSVKLRNCQVDETDLKDVLFFVPSMFSDHSINEYIKSLGTIESY